MAKIVMVSGISRFLCQLVLSLTFVFSGVIYAEELSTVVADGLGKDLDSAMQNAAENALTQAVGSFVDVDKRVERVKEIKGAVKEESKKITSNVSEYSQGTIRNIKVVDTSEENGIVRVTAQVIVRIEAFQSYIREVALGETKVDDDLFSKARADKEKEGNIAQIIVDRVLKDAHSLKVANVEVAKPHMLSEAWPDMVPGATQLLNAKSDDTLIIVPVSAKLKEDFVNNAIQTFEKTASRAFKGAQIAQNQSDLLATKRAFWILVGDGFTNSDNPQGTNHEAILGTNFAYTALGRIGLRYEHYRDILLFEFPKSDVLCDAVINAGLFNPNKVANLPNLVFKIEDNDGNVVMDQLLIDLGQQGPNKHLVKSENAFVALEDNALRLFAFGMDLVENAGMRRCVAHLDTSTNFYVIAKLTNDQLKKAKKIKVSLSPSN